MVEMVEVLRIQVLGHQQRQVRQELVVAVAVAVVIVDQQTKVLLAVQVL